MRTHDHEASVNFNGFMSMKGLASFIYLSVLITIALSGCSALHHTPDAMLIERFYAHQADFEKLLAMLNEDARPASIKLILIRAAIP